MKTNELSRLIKEEMKKRGLKDEQLTAGRLGVSYEVLRQILRDNHIPKNRTLLQIARGLDIDPSILIMAAVRERLPRNLGEFMLTVEHPPSGDWERKRKWPLSQEQCAYLSRLMNSQEIQLVRKYRQLSSDEKSQVVGYINYEFETKRILPDDGGASEGDGTDRG